MFTLKCGEMHEQAKQSEHHLTFVMNFLTVYLKIPIIIKKHENKYKNNICKEFSPTLEMHA